MKGYIEALPVVRSLLAEVAILKAQLDQHKQQSDDASCLRAARAAATRARTLLMRMHAKQLHGNNSGALQHGAPAAQSAAYETGPADREVCTDAHDDELQAWHEETCVNSTDQDATNAPSMSNDSSGQQQQQQQQLQQSQHLQQQQQSQRAKSRALRSLDGDDDDGAEPGHQAGSRQAVGDAEDSDYVPPQLGVPVKHKRGRPPKNVVVQAAMVSVAAGPVSAAKRARGEAPGHAVQNPPVQPQAAARPVPALDAQPQQGAVLAAGSGTCPVCDKSFRLTGLQAHVELCIARAEAVHNQARRTAPTHVDAGAGAVKKHAGASGTGHMHGPSARSGGGAAAAAAPWSMPPKLAFHMLSDKEARRRVMELSLPTAGLNKEVCRGAGTYNHCASAAANTLLCIDSLLILLPRSDATTACLSTFMHLLQLFCRCWQIV